MNVVILGSGRMGQRHGMGIAPLKEVERITFVDIKEEALENAKQQFSSGEFTDKLQFFLPGQFDNSTDKYDIAILASTAGGRLDTVKWLQPRGIRHFLIEKPLGQSLQEVRELENYLIRHKISSSVNLSMRLQDTIQKLRNDLHTLPQLKGPKTIMMNTGSMGIGANGIHYLDLVYFLLDADTARLTAGEIEDSTIPSPRGSEFFDFGGWCKIDYFKGQSFLGKAIFSFSSQSTVFGALEIVGPHGRIMLDEYGQKRIDSIRKEESQLPIYRYAGDYMPSVEVKTSSVFLGDLTKKWLLDTLQDRKSLPSVSEAMGSHELMFSWLSRSKKYKDRFPVT